MAQLNEPGAPDGVLVVHARVQRPHRSPVLFSHRIAIRHLTVGVVPLAPLCVVFVFVCVALQTHQQIITNSSVFIFLCSKNILASYHFHQYSTIHNVLV